jgi:hypothetical protein
MSENGLTTDPPYLEQCITKGLLNMTEFVVLITGAFEPEYFDHPAVQEIFKYTKQHFSEYKEIPAVDILINNIPVDRREGVRDYIREIDSIDIDIVRHYGWLKKESSAYLKDKAIKEAVRNSIDVIDSGADTYRIRTLIESALCRTLDNNIGLDYFGDLGPRLTRMFTDETQRIPTYFPIFDEFLNGGFPPKTLSVFVAKIHGFKCVSYNSYIHIQENGVIKKMKIGDLYKDSCNNVFTGETQMPSLQSFINKHGESVGKTRYEEWRENISKPKSKNAQKGVSKLDLFVNKYGQTEGVKKYESWLDKNRENGKR